MYVNNAIRETASDVADNHNHASSRHLEMDHQIQILLIVYANMNSFRCFIALAMSTLKDRCLQRWSHGQNLRSFLIQHHQKQ